MALLFSRRNFTSSTWPSVAASINGEDAPNSISAPHSSKYDTTSWKPPQLANVSAVSWVSSVCVLILAPVKMKVVSWSKAFKNLKWTRFGPMLPFYTPWKHQKTIDFSGVFRSYKMGTLVRFGLKLFLTDHYLVLCIKLFIIKNELMIKL